MLLLVVPIPMLSKSFPAPPLGALMRSNKLFPPLFILVLLQVFVVIPANKPFVGAGGGGCMIALTRDPKLTSDAIELAGGRTLITKLGSVGVSIDDYEGIPFCQ